MSKMVIWTVWGRRKGEDFPELMVAWDEFCVDGNGEGYDEAVKNALASWGSDLVTHREIRLVVDERDIDAAFATAAVEASVIGGNK